MIELIGVSKYYVTEFGRHYVFRDVSLQLPFDKSIAVVGPNGAGKSTFMRLLGGADVPSEGRIIRTGRISPPMGLTPGLQNSLSAAENARFAGRIYGLTRDEINDLIDHVEETANIGKFFDMPVANYSAGMKQRVAFAINMSLDFDYYLFDEISAGGDREFRKYSKAKVQERLETSNFIIASHRTDELLGICDAGIVIMDGELTYYDDVKDALAAYSVDDDETVEVPASARRRERLERRMARAMKAGAAETASASDGPIAGPDAPMDAATAAAPAGAGNGQQELAGVPMIAASAEQVTAAGERPARAERKSKAERINQRRARIARRQVRAAGKEEVKAAADPMPETATSAADAPFEDREAGVNRRLAERQRRLPEAVEESADAGHRPRHNRLRRDRIGKRQSLAGRPETAAPETHIPVHHGHDSDATVTQTTTPGRNRGRATTDT